MKSSLYLSTALLIAGLATAPIETAARSATASAKVAGKPELGSFGIDLTGMDPKVSPGDDFYRYVNGAWDDRTQIPGDRSSWSSFAILRDLSDQRTRDVMEHVDSDPRAKADAKKAGLLYRSFMDEAAIEAKGAAVLKPDLDAIAAIASTSDLAAAFAKASRDGISTPIALGIDIDDKDPDSYVVAIGQSGLGLPDRDYYLVKDNAKYAEARTAYQAHVAKMLALAGISDSEKKAADIFALETKIAETHWSRVQNRQAEKRYNPFARTALPGSFPGFDWNAFLSAAKLDNQPMVVVGQPSAIQGVIPIMASTPLDTWKAYLDYRTIATRADILPRAFVEQNFQFQKVLSGTPELKVRWKRAVDYVNDGMGEAVGQLYVAHYFPPESKAKMDALVRNILAAMKLRIQNVTWMAPETKTKALQKLAAFRPKIGYPDRFRDYAALRIAAGDAYGNQQRFARFNYDFEVAKLGKPADRGEWGMTPQTVNAYARPNWNEIVFPAAILQAPFFDPNADPAVNYGAIGAVIGHEISHHFDDQGRKFDATGRLSEWWSSGDVTRFKAYTDRVEAQYSAYEPLPGVHVNGGLTLGENMADLAGVTVALDAWKISLGGKPARTIDGFTGEQRFFMAFAQVYRNKARDASVQRQIASDPHTPGNWRPYVVRNLDAWYDAFKVPAGTKFYLAPADRIKVW
jgi:putative endopeptidase